MVSRSRPAKITNDFDRVENIPDRRVASAVNFYGKSKLFSARDPANNFRHRNKGAANHSIAALIWFVGLKHGGGPRHRYPIHEQLDEIRTNMGRAVLLAPRNQGFAVNLGSRQGVEYRQ